jgi:predicted lysophospholipase L1 biosynthesis ABC-type transport system permease subunit
MVVKRRNQIGMRMALGATRTAVIGLVMREAFVRMAVGLPIGIGMALVAAKTAAAMLHGLKPWDSLTLVLAVGSLTLIAAFASFLPALRAVRLEPMTALPTSRGGEAKHFDTARTILREPAATPAGDVQRSKHYSLFCMAGWELAQ